MAVKKSKLREWSDLPVEVREMILVRLPVTKLARHKVVCKAWRSLISSPDFISVHLKRSKSDPTSHRLLFQQYDKIRDLSRSRPSIVCCLPPSAAIVGSVDGLLCIVEFNLRSEYDRIFIMNPVTGYLHCGFLVPLKPGLGFMSISMPLLFAYLVMKDNFYLFAAKWKGKFALVEKGVDDSASSLQTKRTYNVWTMDDEEGVWHVQSSFEVDFTFDRFISNINGKSMLMRKLNEYYYGITLYDVETGQVELIKDFKLSYSVQSAHDFVESFVSIKGFITFQDYDSRNPLPVLRPFSMNGKSKKKNG